MFNYCLVDAEKKKKGFLVNVVLFFISSYQKVFDGRPSTCRFVPSCSTYAIESFEKHCFFRGFLLTIKRLFNCNPWGGYGIDCVPDKKGKVNV